MQYRLFQNAFTDRDGRRCMGDVWNVAFKDHMGRRQSIAASPRDREAHAMAQRVGELVRCRQTGEPLPATLAKWLSIQPDKLRERLIAMDLLDRRMADAGRTLLMHLDGEHDADGQLVEPGFKQALEARGNTPNHVKVTTDRVRRILEGCAFIFWKDINAPGAATAAAVFLNDLRTAGGIGGPTLNYYVRDVRSFTRWLARNGKAPAMALATLEPVKNADVDHEARRSLSVEEMRLLIAAAVDGDVIQGMAGTERAMLYRFAFETGMRPGQIRALLVKDFSLDGDSPTVTTQARHVKRRRVHTQALRPALAAELKELFKAKMPIAAAIKMPSKFHMADMLRRDLAAARTAWIGRAANDGEREERQRSDFLADVNHAGEVATFYGLRHGHGTALAEAGVSMLNIAASMHHASKKTTERYLHADRRNVAQAIGHMPDLSIPQRQVRTGTDGATAETEPDKRNVLRNVAPNKQSPCNPHATGTSQVDSGGQNDGGAVDSPTAGFTPKTAKSAVSGDKPTDGLLAELADAMDSKSIANPSKMPGKQAYRAPARQSPCNPHAGGASGPLDLALAQPQDMDLAEVLAAWPRLEPKQRRQLLLLVRSMARPC